MYLHLTYGKSELWAIYTNIYFLSKLCQQEGQEGDCEQIVSN